MEGSDPPRLRAPGARGHDRPAAALAVITLADGVAAEGALSLANPPSRYAPGEVPLQGGEACEGERDPEQREDEGA